MSLTADQVAKLTAPLDKADVKKNPKGFDYVESYRAIEQANDIFGHDGWDQEIVDLRCVAEGPSRDKMKAAYICRVRVRISDDQGKTTTREDVGFGNQVGQDLGDCHEGAAKEAVSDAVKRCLRTFGNPFGLALYEKPASDGSRSGVAAAPPKPKPAASAEADKYRGRGATPEQMKAVLAVCKAANVPAHLGLSRAFDEGLLDPEAILSAIRGWYAPVGSKPPAHVAFGHEPDKWPSASAFAADASDEQKKMAGAKATERGLTELERKSARRSVAEAYGLTDGGRDSKGGYMLWLDFLIGAGPDSIDKAAGRGASLLQPDQTGAGEG